jgi:hypothetical protein
MYKNMRLYSLMLVLAVLITFAGGWTLKAEGSSFTDMGGAEWARQATDEMAACSVVSGYPDGSYGPYNSVTKLEAVTMLIRMLGLEDQAKAAAEAGVDYKMPADLYWGSGYLIMAVQRGMLDEDFVYLLQPNVPATRTEVAMLVFHALKLNPDSSEMQFEDADQVAAEYRDGVAAVVKSGIMQGLPGNIFKPNDEINRAQMAVMMSSIVKLKYADPCPGRRSEGTVSDIDPASRVINIKALGSIFYAGDCAVYLDGKSILPENLKTGDEVKIILDENRHAVYINALRQGDAQRFNGSVNSLTTVDGVIWLSIIREDGQEYTRSLADGVKLKKSGNKVDVSKLSVGDYIEILVSENKIIEINFLKKFGDIEGKITDLDTTGTWGIDIRNDDGDTTNYEVSEDIDVERDGNSIDFDDLDEGERVRLALDSDNVVTFIEVLDIGQLKGKIINLDTTGTWGISIRSDDGTSIIYEVRDDVDVERDGDNIDFDDLDEGERVKLELDSDDFVDYIEVFETFRKEGVITDLDTAGTWGIDIHDNDGDTADYEVSEDVDVERDGYSTYFDELDEGERVRLEIDSDDIVLFIEVLEKEYFVIEGTVNELVIDTTPLIRIKKSSGSRVQYDIADDADYYRDSYSIDLDDIVIGAEVEVRVKDDKIIRIDITNDENITLDGTVIYISESNNRIKIEQTSGNKFSYPFADDPILKDEDGHSIDINDIEEDSEVMIELEDGEIASLTVLY